jgi:hypothetical protein
MLSSCCCWDRALKAHLGDFSLRAECFHDLASGFPERVIQESRAEMAKSFIDLASEVTHCHCNHILLVTQTDLDTMIYKSVNIRLQGPLEPSSGLSTADRDIDFKIISI